MAIFVTRPSHGLASLNLAELWEYRELIYFLAWRDVKVRYKQTIVGVAWVILQPVAMVAVFYLLFDRMAKLPSDGMILLPLKSVAEINAMDLLWTELLRRLI